MKLTDTQYRILSELFHEMHEVFVLLPKAIITAFYNRLYQGN